MTLTLEIPDYCKDRVIHVIAGIEQIARKYPGKPLEVKKVRCNRCGECCKHTHENWPHGRKENGWCAHLEVDEEGLYSCGFKADIPLGCATGDFAGIKDWCYVEWMPIIP